MVNCCPVLLLGLSLATAGPVCAQTFLSDDPLPVDPDQIDLPKPAATPVSDYYDFLSIFLGTLDLYPSPALNTDTWGEVPQSSWYEPRHATNRQSLDALRRGPGGDGPWRGAPWRVVKLKVEGKTRGVEIIDGHGDRFLFKFDPLGYPETVTGAEAVVTRFFYALGYHVPQNNIVRFQADRLVPDVGSGLTETDLLHLLTAVPRYPDGSYRALASRFLDGEPLGPFRYSGTRPDDANDIFPHEVRRELRGMRVFSAWLGHIDARSANSLDMFIDEDGDGMGYVRHHLIDFGSTLGVGPEGPQAPWMGHRYLYDPDPALDGWLPGQSPPAWTTTQVPTLHGVGHFGATTFDPGTWVPLYPNPAFEQMDAHDAFWAARKVAAFSDEEIRAIVAEGHYAEPAATRYLSDILILRRDRIAQAYLGLGGGLADIFIEEGKLAFDDLLERHHLPSPKQPRRVTWYLFDNQTGRVSSSIPSASSSGFALPPTEADFMLAEILTPGYGRTRVYVSRTGTTHTVVGIDRCEIAGSCVALAAQQAAREQLFAR